MIYAASCEGYPRCYVTDVLTEWEGVVKYDITTPLPKEPNAGVKDDITSGGAFSGLAACVYVLLLQPLYRLECMCG